MTDLARARDWLSRRFTYDSRDLEELAAMLEQVRDEERVTCDQQWRDAMHNLHDAAGSIEIGGFCLALNVVMSARSESKETPA